MTADKSLAQRLGPLFGVFYVAIGVLGFVVTGFHGWVQDTPDTVLGFPSIRSRTLSTSGSEHS